LRILDKILFETFLQTFGNEHVALFDCDRRILTMKSAFTMRNNVATVSLV